MNILVVAATEPEIPRLSSGPRGRHRVDVLVTGVGMVATAAATARATARSVYDVAFNFGLCGTFDRSLPLGTVVHVTSDRLSELGAEDGDAFIPLRTLGLGGAPNAAPALGCFDEDDIENAAPPDNSALRQLPVVRGITVNTVHGNARTIAAIADRLHPQVESMEGAAFAYACRLSGVPYAQVRAVSNVVERRNRDAWQIELAVRHLNETALKILVGCTGDF
jgi:futalosine hydrolase